MNIDQLLELMQHHIGRSRGVSVTALVKEFNDTFAPSTCVARDVRHAVQALRLKGHHICAHPTAGYFLGESPAELHETEDFLRNRAMASLKQVAAMRRVSLPTLIGQQRFLLERDNEH